MGCFIEARLTSDIDPIDCIETPAGLCLVDFEKLITYSFWKPCPEFTANDGPKVKLQQWKLDNEES